MSWCDNRLPDSKPKPKATPNPLSPRAIRDRLNGNSGY